MYRKTAISAALLLSISLTLASSARAEDRQPTLIGVLKSGASPTEKAAACRGLKLVGTADAVPALAALLADKDLSHEARIALEAMPAAEAAAALREAVGKTTGPVRAGILDSIGERRDAEAVPVVAPLLGDADASVVASAALALGKIGTEDAVKLLSEAYEKASADARIAIGEGLVRGADRLRASGKTEAAAAVYGKLAGPNEPATVRASALRAVADLAGATDREKLRAMLASDDPQVRAAGTLTLPTLTDEAMLAVAAGMEKYPQQSQLALLLAFRVRGNTSFAPAAIAAAKSDNAAVAQAGIEAVGALAGSAGADVLLPLTAAGGEKAEAAWRGLTMLRGQNVDAKLIAAMTAEKDAGRHVRMIDVLVARNVRAAVPKLIDDVRSDEGPVRAAAIAAIRRLAAPADVPLMVRSLVGMPKGDDRDELEKGIMLVVSQLPGEDDRTQAVLGGVDMQSKSQRIELLTLLGRIGGAQALAIVEQALASDDAELYEAGVRAISNWPNASVSTRLFELAEKARQPQQRIWALRGAIRVVSLPTAGTEAERLALLRRAMAMATRGEDRALVVERAGAVRSVETLRFVEGYLADAALAQVACRSVVELAHHKELREPNRDAFVPALKRVQEISKDADTLARAKRYLEGN